MRGSFVGLVLLCVAAFALSAWPSAAASGETGLTNLVPPPNGQSYFGFTFRLWDSADPSWGDTRPFELRIEDALANELAGKRPTLLTVWIPWESSFGDSGTDIAKARGVTGPGGVLYVDWTLSTTTAQHGGVTVRDIEEGSQDAYIRNFATALRDYGKPVLVRLFGGEFNGEWWWGQSPRANSSLTPADFAAAWRHVVDLCRQAGALNVSWAWIPNAFPPDPVPWVDSNLSAYYPGDDYVDWAGADIYDNEQVNWLDGAYAFASGHAKPFFLAEWGIRHGRSTRTPAEQDVWLQTMFDYIEGHPAVKAINYFNYNGRPDSGIPLDPSKVVSLHGGAVTYQANTNDSDYRLLADSGAGFRTTFATRISSPRYRSTIVDAPLASPGRPRAILFAPVIHGPIATLHWSGSSTAATFDLAAQHGHSWSVMLSNTTRTSFSLRGSHGTQFRVRLRAHDAAGVAGAWSQPRTITFR
jgi:hypothetical protein